MKIVHVFRSPVGGIFRHVRDLLGEQSKAGHQVGIICDSNTGGKYEENLFQQILPELELGLHRIGMARSIAPTDISTFFKVRKLISKLNPDIVHSHSAKGGIHGRLAAKFGVSGDREPKAFYSPHGGAMHYASASLKGKIFFAAERFMERYTDCLIFVSEYERDAFHDKVGTPSCPEAVIYNGLTEGEFEPVEAIKGAADFLYIGMMRDLKGPDIFLEALNLVRHRSGQNVTGMFVGDGPDKPKYVQRISELGLDDHVKVHAAMPAREAFRQAKFVVVPSRAESMPYLVLEAIAAQKPVIATNVGGIPEIFGGRKHELVPPGDADKLAIRMLDALKNSTTRANARTAASELKKRFSLPVMAQGIEEIYNR